MQSFSLLVKLAGNRFCICSGAVYLAVQNPATLLLAEIQKAVWQSIIQGDEKQPTRKLLRLVMLVLWMARAQGLPQTLELFTPAELIRKLPT